MNRRKNSTDSEDDRRHDTATNGHQVVLPNTFLFTNHGYMTHLKSWFLTRQSIFFIYLTGGYDEMSLKPLPPNDQLYQFLSLLSATSCSHFVASLVTYSVHHFHIYPLLYPLPPLVGHRHISHISIDHAHLVDPYMNC